MNCREALRVSSPHLCSGISLKGCINLIFFRILNSEFSSWLLNAKGNFKSVGKLIWFRFYLWQSDSNFLNLRTSPSCWSGNLRKVSTIFVILFHFRISNQSFTIFSIWVFTFLQKIQKLYLFLFTDVFFASVLPDIETENKVALVCFLVLVSVHRFIKRAKDDQILTQLRSKLLTNFRHIVIRYFIIIPTPYIKINQKCILIPRQKKYKMEIALY